MLATVVVAGVAGGLGNEDQHAAGAGASGGATGTATVTATGPSAAVAPTPAPTAAPVVVTAATTPPVTTSVLRGTIGEGSYGDDVMTVQRRLTELGFDPGPVDGQFGGLTRAAVWAFEKLVLQTPRAEATGRVTNEMWSRMQGPVAIVPRRPNAASVDHTEIYLPEQVVVVFAGDRPALISHMASGTGEEWCDEVTISPGEMGNEHGTDPLQRGECGRSDTPGGVFRFYRRVEGVRESALGGMWNPVYFNYGIAVHGALNVPLEPASHGCIRIPLTLSETFQDLVSNGDQVFVFDGVKEPEAYGAQLPTFNWRDPDDSTPTPTASAGPVATTSPPIAPPPGR